MNKEILEINNLSVSFRNGNETVTAVEKVSFILRKGKTLGIVGESGSGKSVMALAVMNLLPKNAMQAGSMTLFNESGGGTELTNLSARRWQHIRGNRISMIFQEPMTSLNPVMRCGKQVTEAILAHQSVTRKELRKKTFALFREVLLPDPEGAFNAYPHELSGGQRQRIMIAMALSSGTDILIADDLLVMKQGRVVESGCGKTTLRSRRHDPGAGTETAHVAQRRTRPHNGLHLP